MAAIGDTLVGRFRLEHELGRGGFATVFLATDRLLSTDRLQRRVAVKILDPRLVAAADDRDFLARFKGEASVIAALDHPNILGLHDYGEVDGTAYLVMPYVAGGTLQERLRGGQSLPLAETWLYLRQAADALDYAHRHQLVHRDVKPQNMLLREGGQHLLLADFGLARLLSSASAHSRTGILGTVAYMAPEQFQGQVGRATDVYALGCVLFQLLTGQLPYSGPTEQVMFGHIAGPIPSVLAQSRGAVPAAIQPVIERALAKQPGARFASAGDLARAFAAAASGPATTPVGSAEPRLAPDSGPAPASAPAWPASPAGAQAVVPAAPAGTGVPGGLPDRSMPLSGPPPAPVRRAGPVSPVPGLPGRASPARVIARWIGGGGLVLIMLAWSFLASLGLAERLSLSAEAGITLIAVLLLLFALTLGLALGGASRGNRWPFALTFLAIPPQILLGGPLSPLVLLLSCAWVAIWVGIGLWRERRR